MITTSNGSGSVAWLASCLQGFILLYLAFPCACSPSPTSGIQIVYWNPEWAGQKDICCLVKPDDDLTIHHLEPQSAFAWELKLSDENYASVLYSHSEVGQQNS
ncbi:hypothetical protein AV530_001750 [Patagioenas fasciata monilis]|uniref:Uncharacterized protein n=1 Tax=Patagioenas fasciata monilis TaxID=372326 RepID=A0A1V4KM94_PATFA|nr:hypothetical protein AV530_001750 [Patagioenas fasciata monilis]